MKEGLLNELKKISTPCSPVDEDHTYHYRRGSRASDASHSHSPIRRENSPSHSRVVQDTRHSRSTVTEEELKALRDRLLDETRELVAVENAKVKEEFGEFFGQLVKQIKLLAATRRQEREQLEQVEAENEEIIEALKSLNGRMEKLESQIFNFEMDLCSTKEKRTLRSPVAQKSQMDERKLTLMDSIIEDHSQKEKLAQKLEEFESKHDNLEDALSKLSSCLDEKDQKTAVQIDKLKADLGKKVNQSLQDVETRITDLVQTALQEQGRRASHRRPVPQRDAGVSPRSPARPPSSRSTRNSKTRRRPSASTSAASSPRRCSRSTRSSRR